MLEPFLKQLQQEMGLDTPFPKEAPGIWAVPLDETTAITVVETPPTGFILSCTLGPINSAKEGEIIKEMMSANLFGRGTNGAVLGLDDDKTQAILNQYVITNVDYKRFKEIVEDFITSVDVWQEEIVKR